MIPDRNSASKERVNSAVKSFRSKDIRLIENFSDMRC